MADALPLLVRDAVMDGAGGKADEYLVQVVEVLVVVRQLVGLQEALDFLLGGSSPLGGDVDG